MAFRAVLRASGKNVGNHVGVLANDHEHHVRLEVASQYRRQLVEMW